MSETSSDLTLEQVVARLRDDMDDFPVVLLFAYNRTGKTRLSMAFKDAGKQGDTRDTLYFNAFTEDLFVWDNDLVGDSDRYLVLNRDSRFFDALNELALDPTIDLYLKRYADFDFDIDYTDLRVSFRKDNAENIKISRGEQNIFIWCVFMAIAERLLDGHESYATYRYIYVDDPISSLDDNNAISMACDLAKVLRRAARRRDEQDTPDPIKVIVSTHHTLFFNVMYNELKRRIDDLPPIKNKPYFLHRSEGMGRYTLTSSRDVPYFQHIAALAELRRAADPVAGALHPFHFNALRTVMEKTSSFFGHVGLSYCLQELEVGDDRELFNRALNLLSHGPYSIYESSVMSGGNQDLFRRMLDAFITRFEFVVPAVIPVQPAPGGQAA